MVSLVDSQAVAEVLERAPVILASARVIDGQGSMRSVAQAVRGLQRRGVAPLRLEIESLRRPWSGPLAPNAFRSGCGPIMALERACAEIASGRAEAVLIQGDEPLRSGYSRAERHRLMDVYQGLSVPEAYTRLGVELMARWGISREQFRALGDLLLENCGRTARERGLSGVPGASGGLLCTELFRYADCANPHIDFTGAMLLGAPEMIAALEDPPGAQVVVRGVKVEIVPDGPEHVGDIVAYDHLHRAFQGACEQAGVDFVERFLKDEALLEAYTCFPPVPLGFLLSTGIAAHPGELSQILRRCPITVTGGMNLARAPWNNPALNALIVMHKLLVAKAPRIGLVHGNGGVGGYQGVALLERLGCGQVDQVQPS